MKRLLTLLALLTISALPVFAQVTNCNIVQVNGGSTGSTAGVLELKRLVLRPTSGTGPALDALSEDDLAASFDSHGYNSVRFRSTATNYDALTLIGGNGVGAGLATFGGDAAGGNFAGVGLIVQGGYPGTGAGELGGPGGYFSGGSASAGSNKAGVGLVITDGGDNASAGNDGPAAAQIQTASDYLTAFGAPPVVATVPGIVGSGLTPQKNKAKLFPFVMYDSAGNPKAGLTVACQKSLNGVAWADCAGTITTVGLGGYFFSAAAADMNAAAMILKFTAGNAKTLMIPIITQP